MQGFRPGATKITRPHGFPSHAAEGVLGRNNHLVTPSMLLHPLDDPLLALATLVHVGGIDAVAAEVVEVVSDSLRLSLRLRLSIGPIEPISGLS